MKIMNLKVGAIGTNCFIAYDENTLQGVVVDPGDNSDFVIKNINDNNIDLKYVLLTHGHFDHILAVNDVCEKTGAKLVINEKDSGYLKKEVVAEYRSFLKNEYIEREADVLAKDGTIIHIDNIDFEYISTPGHTPGSSVIKAEDCLFTGDTLFKNECGRCDLAGGNFDEMLSSLKKLHDMEGDYHVLPGHEDMSTLVAERKNNPYIRQAISR